MAVARGCDTTNSKIFITDQLPMLDLMKQNIFLNHLSETVHATVLDWGTTISADIPRFPDLVLAADCVYFEPSFPLLILTLQNLMGPNSICYFCFKKRRRADFRFVKQARKHFEITEIEDNFGVDFKRENLFLYSIRKK